MQWCTDDPCFSTMEAHLQKNWKARENYDSTRTVEMWDINFPDTDDEN